MYKRQGKRSGILLPERQTAPLRLPPDLWLIFAPIKKARTDFIVEKAVELGAAREMCIRDRSRPEMLPSVCNSGVSPTFTTVPIIAII